MLPGRPAVVEWGGGGGFGGAGALLEEGVSSGAQARESAGYSRQQQAQV